MWREIPSTYAICEKDSAILPAVQQRMARRAHRVERLNTSHSPFMSRPSRVESEIVQFNARGQISPPRQRTWGRSR
jgi:hypothetical protein